VGDDTLNGWLARQGRSDRWARQRYARLVATQAQLLGGSELAHCIRIGW